MLIYNAIRTPDGTIIESTHRHDYVTHLDVNGNEYMIDGGLDYIRRSAYGDEDVLSISFEDSTFDEQRTYLKWGTRGINRDQPLSRISIKDMDIDHIQACLDTQSQMSSMYRTVMEQELTHRTSISV